MNGPDGKSPLNEPSSDEYQQIARGFDDAASGLIRGTAVWLRRFGWGFLFVFALLILAYFGEDLWLRWEMAHGRQEMESVTVTRYYAIHKKGGKIEYASDDPVAQSCVDSAFPHFGAEPCWYLRRNRHPIVDM